MFEEIMAKILMKTVNPLLQKVWQTLSTRHMKKMTGRYQYVVQNMTKIKA